MVVNKRKKPQYKMAGCPRKEQNIPKTALCDVLEDTPACAQPQHQHRQPNPPTPCIVFKLGLKATSTPQTLVYNQWMFVDDSHNNATSWYGNGAQPEEKEGYSSPLLSLAQILPN